MYGVKLWMLGLVVAAMLAARWRRVGTLAWSLLWWVGLYALLKWGFDVPIPASVLSLYMGIITLSIFAYVSSSRERVEAFMAPIVRLVTDPGLRLLLLLVVLALPSLMALNVYMKTQVPLEAPAFGRTVHPAPPDSITVHDNPVDLITADNPLRELETGDSEAFRAHLDNGRRIYFENCFYCHGDAAAGDGMFAHALNPVPTDFTDQGVLPSLQESFLFWRISKGAPGMPAEGGPWDSAMPAWENFLTEEEIWEVTAFLYDYTEWSPRARVEHH